jgi:hypothetical protein
MGYRLQDFGPRIAVDGQSNTFLAMNFTGSLPVGEWTLESGGAYAIALLQLDPTGALRWVRRFGNGLNAYATGLALDGAGNVFLAGQFRPSLEIVAEQTLVAPAADHDAMFIAEIAP